MDSLWPDLRYAARRLGRAPAFTLAAGLTLVVGGACIRGGSGGGGDGGGQG